MSTLAGLLNHPSTAGSVPSRNTASPMASPASGAGGTNNASGSATNSATVSANDFLTLLVTEMKNQDPTANTDPNEYINQLVNVNSLEQLIGINQTLSTALGSPSSASNGGASPRVTTDASSAGNSPAPTARAPHVVLQATSAPAAYVPQASSITGNLSVPQANPAAVRVGHSLTERPHPLSMGRIPLANQ